MKRHSQQGKTQVETMSAAAVTLTMFTLLFSFAMVPAQAQTPTVLYSFMNSSSDAPFPQGNIVQDRDGNMYGVGGRPNAAAVYKISPAGVESIFFNFPTSWADCNLGGLTLGSDGNFYGVCTVGNPATQQGSIYRLTPAGVFTDLHDFPASGNYPVLPPIQASDGNFYGVLNYGGNGSVYKMTPAGVVTTIHTFVSPDVQPISGLFQASDGNFYATITLCGLTGNRGCVYKLTTGGTYKNIYGFADPTGSGACAGVIQGKDGKLYGASSFGGANGNGTLYNLTTAGVHTVLHDFNSVTDGGCGGVSNLFTVPSLLQVNDGTFYGANNGGGSGNGGSIFKLTSANVFTPFLLSNAGGISPYTTPIQNTNGLVYGTTSSGGANGVGNFFSVSTGDAAFVNLEPTQKSGFVGASVGMFGQGFSSASVVKFGGVVATTKTLSGTTYITAVVPAGAHTGTVMVTTGTTTLTSPQTYKVKPKILNFTPTSGHVAQLVTINGTGLIQTTGVKFGKVKATTFTVVSDSQVTAVVPTLPLGAVTIAITTPGGTANSPTKFTVN